MTEWRVIPSFPLYEASADGQVRRTIPYPAGRTVAPLRPHLNAGYHYVSPGHRKHVAVHVLVCEAFYGPKPTRDHEVAHYDGNRLNNSAVNLRWALHKQNSDDRRRHGTVPVGERAGGARLTTAQVANIRTRNAEAASALAAEFGVTKETINNIRSGRTWRENCHA